MNGGPTRRQIDGSIPGYGGGNIVSTLIKTGDRENGGMDSRDRRDGEGIILRSLGNISGRRDGFSREFGEANAIAGALVALSGQGQTVSVTTGHGALTSAPSRLTPCFDTQRRPI